MKEAAGELSMTAVAVVAIAAIGVVFATLVYPAIRNGIRRQTYCSQAIACTDNGDNTRTCSYYDESNTLVTGLVCSNDDLD